MSRLLLATAAILLTLATSANAWGSRCNTQEAKEKYVCTFLTTCAGMGVTYQQLQGMTQEQAIAIIEPKVAQGNYSFWEQYTVQGQKLPIATIKTMDKTAWVVQLTLAVQVITDFKTAAVDDYHCQANITFDEAKLHKLLTGVVLGNFFSQPLHNPALLGFLTKDEKMFLNFAEMTATRAAQCINRNPIYVEGLVTFEVKNSSTCPQ